MSVKDFDLLHAARTEDIEESLINQLTVIGKTEESIIGKLKYSGSHLLQGARGIGKSMLLREAESELDNEFNKERNLAVYVNFKTSTLLEGVKADNKNAFQIWVAAKILQSLYSKLISLGIITNSTSSDPFNRIFGVQSIYRMKETLQEKIHLLQQLSKKDKKDTILDELGDDFLDKVNDISYVSEIIKEIITEYSLNRIVFLFDEAAHTFIPEQQEIFFEIFKLLHGGKVAVKAAVYPSITSYGKNFEIGHDAILIPLGDFIPGSAGRNASRSLYRELISRRMPETGTLRKEIFSRGELLDQCIHLSSGNPRAFLHLFNRVYDRGYTDRALLLSTQDYVDQELLPYHLGLVKRLPKYSHHVKLGLDILREYIIPEIKIKNNREKKTKYQSAFFTLQRDMPPNLKLAFDLLCYSGVLSKQGTIKIASKKTGQRYMIHLALMFTEKAFISNNFSNVINMISLTDYREFSAEDPQFDHYLDRLKDSADECLNCSAEIPATAKFCPECGSKIQEKSIVGALLDDSIRNLSISSLIADRIEPEYPRVGDVVHTTRSDLMNISYIKEVRSRMVKNAADEYISG
ncbi:MAG: zinc ribbon domain-containing protein [Spirochaetaceae bacterium]|jgi:RNA polymerase subunit RPABC4/transcription elongation factor Spt4|nr:zinc ribbon domain-containing protein [Spirochaetaceae bacterium]